MHSHGKRSGLKKRAGSHANHLAGRFARLWRVLPRYKLIVISWLLLVATTCVESDILNILISEGPGALYSSRPQLIRLGGVCLLLGLSLMILFIGLDRALERSVRLSARVRSLKKRVEVSRTELDSIKEGFPIGLFLVSLQNKVRYANAQFLSLTGLSAAEQNRKSWFESVTPEQRQKIALCWQEAFDAQLAFTELISITSKESIRWVRIRLVPVRVRSIVVGYVGTAVEETAHVENDELIRRLLSRIEDAQGKLDQTVDSLRTFTATEMLRTNSNPISQTVVVETPITFTPDTVPIDVTRDLVQSLVTDSHPDTTYASCPALGDEKYDDLPSPKKTRRRRSSKQSPLTKSA